MLYNVMQTGRFEPWLSRHTTKALAYKIRGALQVTYPKRRFYVIEIGEGDYDPLLGAPRADMDNPPLLPL